MWNCFTLFLAKKIDSNVFRGILFRRKFNFVVRNTISSAAIQPLNKIRDLYPSEVSRQLKVLANED